MSSIIKTTLATEGNSIITLLIGFLMPYFFIVLLGVLLSPPDKFAALAIVLFSLYKLFKLLTRNPEPLLAPSKVLTAKYGLGYRILEMNTYKDFLIDDKRLILYTATSRMYDFSWNDFTSYAINNKTLYLIKSHEQQMIMLEQSKIGKIHFRSIFSEVIERLNRLEQN